MKYRFEELNVNQWTTYYLLCCGLHYKVIEWINSPQHVQIIGVYVQDVSIDYDEKDNPQMPVHCWNLWLILASTLIPLTHIIQVANHKRTNRMGGRSNALPKYGQTEETGTHICIWEIPTTSPSPQQRGPIRSW